MKADQKTEAWTDEECGIASVQLEEIIGREACVKICEMAGRMPTHAKVMEFFESTELHPLARMILSKTVEAYRREYKRNRASN